MSTDKKTKKLLLSLKEFLLYFIAMGGFIVGAGLAWVLGIGLLVSYVDARNQDICQEHVERRVGEDPCVRVQPLLESRVCLCWREDSDSVEAFFLP